MTCRFPRRIVVGLLLLLTLHLALLIDCAIHKSICFDEGAHLSAGLAYLNFGEFAIYDLSPPLLRMWAALPAVAMHPQLPPTRKMLNSPARERHWIYFQKFQEANLERVHLLVLCGRFALMPISLVGALLIFFVGQRLYDPRSALLATAAWCISPTVIANGSTLGTDMGSAVAMFLSMLLFTGAIRSGRKSSAIGAGLAIGIAHAIKFTALLIWPILVATAIFDLIGRRTNRRIFLPVFGIAILLTFLIFNAVYGFSHMNDRLDQFTFHSHLMRGVQKIFPSSLPIPLSRYAVEGFDAQTWEAEGVYITTLFNRAYFGNDWRYYPWLVLTKSTVGGIILLLAAGIGLFVRKPTADEWPLLIFTSVCAVGIFFGAHLNIGLRYLLPIYAPAILLVARCAKPIVIFAVCASAIETFAAMPRMHSFVNAVARPWQIYVPDQDWGQSLIDLKSWMRQNDQSEICLLYLGTADPRAYGIPRVDPFAPVTTPYVAMSKSALEGWPVRLSEGFAFVRTWRRLRETKPLADLGGLIVFRAADVESPDGRPWIVRIADWKQALTEPELIPIKNFNQRLLQE